MYPRAERHHRPLLTRSGPESDCIENTLAEILAARWRVEGGRPEPAAYAGRPLPAGRPARPPSINTRTPNFGEFREVGLPRRDLH